MPTPTATPGTARTVEHCPRHENAPPVMGGAQVPHTEALPGSDAEQRGHDSASAWAVDTSSIPTWRAIDDFRTAILDAGLGDPGPIEPDGEVHRFRTEDDKPGAKSGWYSLHLDGLPAGIFGSWKLGEVRTWCSVSRDRQTPAQRADIRRLVEQVKAQRATETRDRQAEAARRARIQWDSASPADPGHPYLAAKQIGAHGIRQQGVALLVPVYVGGTLASLQTIYGDGTKRFLPGGRIAGGSFLIDDATRRPEILIAEGFATAATLHEETGAGVYVAFNAGNLLGVARQVRALHPGGTIILCADNDAWTDGNPGLTKARAAAIEIGGKLLVPDFSGMDLSSRPTDFNDLYRLRRQVAGGAE